MPSGELDRYRAKRDLQRTAEPQGQHRRRRSSAPRFVIQQHEARRMHYDLRLEVDGGSKSWAVPKGPSAGPREKRLGDGAAQIGFSEWTRDCRLRHPRFLGLREDKAAEEAVREQPQPAELEHPPHAGHDAPCSARRPP